MSYKGEEIEVAALQPGMAVEVLDATLYPNAQKDEKGRLVGVVLGKASYASASLSALPSLGVFSKTGEMKSLYATRWVYSKDKVFKQLTGIAGKQLERLANGPAMFKSRLQKSPSIVSGTDPEVFAVDEKGNVIPAWLWLQSKEEISIAQQQDVVYNPKLMKYEYVTSDKKYTPNEKPFWDGAQAEFSATYGSCACGVMDSIRRGLKATQTAVRAKFPNARLTAHSTFEIPEEYLVNADSRFLEFGCSPSKNAYGSAGQVLANPRMLKHRFSGGHIHMGMPKDPEAYKRYAKTIDIVAGVASVGMFEGYDSSVRRQFYGLAGEYREPNHGMEYRTLSSAWLCHPAFAQLMFDLVRAGVWVEANKLRSAFKMTSEEAELVINTTDVAKARHLVENDKEAFKAVVEWLAAHANLAGARMSTPQDQAEAAYKAVMEGAQALLKKPDDIEDAWMLSSGGWAMHNESPHRQWHNATPIIMRGNKL